MSIQRIPARKNLRHARPRALYERPSSAPGLWGIRVTVDGRHSSLGYSSSSLSRTRRTTRMELVVAKLVGGADLGVTHVPGIVTVPVQDGGTDGRTDNRPVPSLGCWSSQHAVPSPDGSKDGRPVHRKTEDGRMILVGNSARPSTSRASRVCKLNPALFATVVADSAQKVRMLFGKKVNTKGKPSSYSFLHVLPSSVQPSTVGRPSRPPSRPVKRDEEASATVPSTDGPPDGRLWHRPSAGTDGDDPYQSLTMHIAQTDPASRVNNSIQAKASGEVRVRTTSYVEREVLTGQEVDSAGIKDIGPDFVTKLSIIRVCKTWHRIGLEFLYESVTLNWIGQLPSFVSALEAVSGDGIGVGAFVRRLEIGYWVPRGYQILQNAELNKIFRMCPRLTHFAFNPQCPLGSLPAFPRVPNLRAGSQGELRVTHLEIGDRVEYPAILPALVELSPTLESLSILLPVVYDNNYPTLTFAHLQSLRLGISLHSRLPGAHWVIPNLQQLLIHAAANYDYVDYNAVFQFLEAYGGTLKVLRVGRNPSFRPTATPIDFQQLLLPCPVLQHLSVNEGSHSDTPLHPEAEWSADVLNKRSCLEFEHLKTTFPALRMCRYLDACSDFFPNLPPISRSGADSVPDIGYILPQSSYLELLFSEACSGDNSSDSDYIFDPEDDDDGSVGASDSDSSDSTDLPTEDSDDEWEVDREEAVTIFRQTLIA
ncbi:hypothetical protein K438DRAFT_1971607 [Mycena galopus ATCC 62051]|nr:hypothetical protein K438DRAFT_1971607 [Mycena galopus ATCC 62051]